MSTSLITRARRAIGKAFGGGDLRTELRAATERISQLESDLDELRRDNLRVAELLDLAEQMLTPQAVRPESDQS